jgi:hypothetical protein
MYPETTDSLNEINIFNSMSKPILQKEKMTLRKKIAKNFYFKTPKILKDFYHLFFPVTIILGALICVIFIAL